jgi:hypothetical protein
MRFSTVQLTSSVILSLLAVPVIADMPNAQLNRLEGVVVSKADGRPLADVPVVMVHAEDGHLTIGSNGVEGSGAQRLDPRAFVTHNVKVACDALTAADGTFVLRSFCAPAERWIVAAGDREHGFYLRAGIVPADYAEAPLRIEIDAPAYVVVDRPPDAPDGSWRGVIRLAVADLAGEPGAGGDAGEQDDDPASHVTVAAWPEKPDEPVWRLGPVPSGFTYRVALSQWSQGLQFHVLTFERRVFLRPGAAERVLLKPEPGLTLSGRITDKKEQPLKNVNVRLHTHGASGIVLGALSDADGRYVIKDAPGGTHTLELLRYAKPPAPT